MLVQAPDNSNNSLRLPHKSLCCAGSRQFKSLLTPVLASNDSHANPDACAGSQQFKQFLTPGQASNNSHVNPYTCSGCDNAKNSLRLCRFPTIHTRILMLVQVPHNSNNYLRWERLPTVHRRILTLVQVPTMLKVPYACVGFQKFTRKSLHL
ncbi:hypothetical protein O181_035930 [Austropuccinia psidii MF-1]|uniref:Uncharacterized protein n=1 Tax=Austropuccinia psidii MF-1 TaxID=1389203 RepID=A0A9Q3D5K9_9BASI|nr:hypothetical protein [Austropuccinia psidii MF-1]